jgi:hypothetical protein
MGKRKRKNEEASEEVIGLGGNMKLQQEIQLRLSTCSLKDISHLMGYKDVSPVTRIRDVMNDPHLGLFKGGYDLKFSDAEFLSTLCSVVGIDIKQYQEELDAVQADHDDRRDRFKSYVFVDTDFVRTTQPIFVLGFCQGQRCISLDYEIRIKPINEQVEGVQNLVKRHYIDHDGELGVWGDIKRYLFVYAEGFQLEISPDGDVLGESTPHLIEEASLTVGNKDITSIITNDK